MISLTVLKEIISDTTIKTSSSLKRIGITGSYARGDYTERSDIDLVFDIEGPTMDAPTLEAGITIKSIISDQFGHDVDIIIYGGILEKIEQKDISLVLLGYKQMLEDLKWIWESSE